MRKITWKEAVLNIIKQEGVQQFKSQYFNEYIKALKKQTRSRTTQPMRAIRSTINELCDLGILEKVGPNLFTYIKDNHNECLVYKDTRSIGHIRIANFLTRHNITFEEEKTFKDLKHKQYLRFDFFLVIGKRHVAIEYDGVQHTKEITHWGGSKTLSESRYRDQLKNRYCKKNGILLIRINHDIKNIEKHVRGIILHVLYEEILIAIFLCIQYIYFLL